MPALLQLIQSAFAPLDARITPPSSANALTLDALRHAARKSEIWALGTLPVACIILTETTDALYIGKLAVREEAQGNGYANDLMQLAAERASHKGLPALTLDVRIELMENHALFRKFGFVETSRGAHEGFDRPTFLTMHKSL